MKRWIAQAAVVVVAGCAAAPTHQSLDYVTRSKTGEGPTTEELVNDHRSPDDVLTYGMGYSSGHAGVRLEHAARQLDQGVELLVLHQHAAQCLVRGARAEQHAVGHDSRSDRSGS